ncbi:hypothetical protein R3I94_007056 [Phoxinus phoxinus]
MTTAYVGHLFLMSLYITVLHTLPAPANLTIVSHNFRHILQWNPGIDSPPRTVFNFRQRCGGKSKQVRSCLNITNTTVDVSETVKDIYSLCTFTVWASLGNTTSVRVQKSFTPYEDTIIGPPIISLSGCENCLNISISLPVDTTITEQMRQFYRSGSFNISWKKAGQSEAEQIPYSGTQHVLENLQPGEQYCVRAIPQISSNHNTRASAWQCEYTRKVEPRGGLYVMSWSLGASVAGVAVLLLALGLLYTGFLCKLKTPPLKSLNNIVTQAHFLIPEETLCERVTSTEAPVNTASKNYPNYTLGVEEDSGKRQHEENYANKADTDDEEDDEDDEEGGARDAAIGDIHHDDPERNHTLLSEVFEDNNNTRSESKGDEEGSANINLFSVTLRALAPQDDEDELCKPLLLESVLGLSASDRSVLEEHTEEEEELLLDATPTALRPDEEADSPSGYMVTHTGDMSELKRSSSEEAECDTDYLTR